MKDFLRAIATAAACIVCALFMGHGWFSGESFGQPAHSYYIHYTTRSAYP